MRFKPGDRTQPVSQLQRDIRPVWQRRIATVCAASFAWTFVLAVPAKAMAHGARVAIAAAKSYAALVRREHAPPRPLSQEEMSRITGGGTLVPYADTGRAYRWQSMAAGANTANGNKLTSIPLVG